MYARTDEKQAVRDVNIAPDVLDYIAKRNCDFRICTSCGGPILLPVQIKPPKSSDLLLHAGNHIVYVSVHQARYLHTIRMDMVPFFNEMEFNGHDE
jgi:hypothetical protein